jgi:hypothetical protein
LSGRLGSETWKRQEFAELLRRYLRTEVKTGEALLNTGSFDWREVLEAAGNEKEPLKTLEKKKKKTT